MVLEAIRGRKATNEIAAEFEVHPTRIGYWKKQVLEMLDYGIPQEAYWSETGKRSRDGWKTAPPLVGLASKTAENHLILGQNLS